VLKQVEIPGEGGESGPGLAAWDEKGGTYPFRKEIKWAFFVKGGKGHVHRVLFKQACDVHMSAPWGVGLVKGVSQ